MMMMVVMPLRNVSSVTVFSGLSEALLPKHGLHPRLCLHGDGGVLFRHRVRLGRPPGVWMSPVGGVV